MRSFKKFLIEGDKKQTVVFKETDGVSPFPDMALSAISKKITLLARDLQLEWKSAAHLVDAALKELDVPKPQVYQKHRWAQYVEMMAHATKQLYESRGLKSGWTQSI